MSGMIDRIARAMREADKCDDPGSVDFDGLARAAIEAMREPTQEMVDACDINIPTEGMITGIWTDMIVAALDKVAT